MFLNKNKLLSLIDSQELIIKPLLDKDCQIGEISIDFRLGYDFLVSIQGRDSFINASLNEEKDRAINSFFQETRRTIGETFLLHPNQTVLATSLEYVKIPKNTFAIINMRSSYNRLGISLSTIIQPGYCGCISLELTNNNNNPVNLAVGALLFQARFVQLDEPCNYFSKKRKYICQVRPIVSAINEDSDLLILNYLWKLNNHSVHS